MTKKIIEAIHSQFNDSFLSKNIKMGGEGRVGGSYLSSIEGIFLRGGLAPPIKFLYIRPWFSYVCTVTPQLFPILYRSVLNPYRYVSKYKRHVFFTLYRNGLYRNVVHPFLLNDLQTPPPLKRSRFDGMILTHALCFEKNEKPKKKIRFLVFEIWSIS